MIQDLVYLNKMIDPKLKLGRAAIEANLCYYQAQEHKYSNQYREALEQTTYWLRELEKLKETKCQIENT